jgi:hypothetical protein
LVVIDAIGVSKQGDGAVEASNPMEKSNVRIG